MQFRLSRCEKIGMAASLTVVLSTLLPWSTQGLGRVSTSGIGYGYVGEATAVLGLVAFAAVLTWGWRVRTRALLSTAGLFVGLAAVETTMGLTAGTNPGLGLVTTGMAATALVATGTYGLVTERVRQHRLSA
ncbi:hypothetical protein [Halostella litorea]|uniref:hypothetical protein n=1 Tax=Halostella litorea TaxID=2528831 RepID=UPI0010919F0F|nr:hypothetical protein [Halostella litorea]